MATETSTGTSKSAGTKKGAAILGSGNIVHETSPDGLVWTADNTSLAAASQAWVVRDGTTLRMWYAYDEGIGQATLR